VIATTWHFVEVDETGEAYLRGTRTKVIAVALDQIAHDWHAGEIHRQYPDLSLPQIHAALGYYHENRAECDRRIDEGLHRVREMREQVQNPLLVAKLRARRGRH